MIMDLYFSRRRFLNTSFYAPVNAAGLGNSSNKRSEELKLKEVYRVTTTKSAWSLFPEYTYIKCVGGAKEGREEEEKEYDVARITWRWPSQDVSYIELFRVGDATRNGNGGKEGGKGDGEVVVMKLNEFLKRGEGFAK